MRTLHLSVLTATVLVLVFGGTGPAWSQPTQPAPNTANDCATGPSRPLGRYRTVDLGTLGGTQSSARAINDRGEIAGDSDTAIGEVHPVLWRKGRMIDLGLPGGYQGRAYSLNNRGQVVGAVNVPGGYQHAFVWQDGVLTDLGTLGGPISAAYGINDDGLVVGVSITAGLQWHAFAWRHGIMTDLGAFDAAGVNNRGQVIGTAGDVFVDLDAVMWQHGRLTTLDPATARATGINDHGAVIGALDSETGIGHSFVWCRGRLTDLGTLGGSSSSAYGINNLGQIVGESTAAADPAPEHPFLWQHNTMIDLSNRGLSPDAFVVAINNHAQIVGGYGGHAALFT